MNLLRALETEGGSVVNQEELDSAEGNNRKKDKTSPAKNKAGARKVSNPSNKFGNRKTSRNQDLESVTTPTKSLGPKQKFNAQNIKNLRNQTTEPRPPKPTYQTKTSPRVAKPGHLGKIKSSPRPKKFDE